METLKAFLHALASGVERAGSPVDSGGSPESCVPTPHVSLKARPGHITAAFPLAPREMFPASRRKRQASGLFHLRMATPALS